MKNNKSLGADETPAELLKYGGRKLTSRPHIIVLKVWRRENAHRPCCEDGPPRPCLAACFHYNHDNRRKVGRRGMQRSGGELRWINTVDVVSEGVPPLMMMKRVPIRVKGIQRMPFIPIYPPLERNESIESSVCAWGGGVIITLML